MCVQHRMESWGPCEISAHHSPPSVSPSLISLPNVKLSISSQESYPTTASIQSPESHLNIISSNPESKSVPGGIKVIRCNPLSISAGLQLLAICGYETRVTQIIGSQCMMVGQARNNRCRHHGSKDGKMEGENLPIC